jgi:CubicO group peptidase (beta-lactamase class C family)
LKRQLLLVSFALTAFAVWLFAPVYQFYAHRGIVSLPPWGWSVLEGPAPESQQVFDPDFELVGNRVLKAMAAYRSSNNLPSLSAAVAVDDQLVWAGSVGFSDIADRMPATPDTLFRIGSTSKALTATALARLVQRGEIDLDAPVSAYSRSASNPTWAKVTARQLASHSAGMPHYGENGDFIGLYRSVTMRRHYDDVRDALAIFDTSPLLSEPGSRFHYSSLGTVLLGAAMSDAAGVTYREMMRREVFQPAEMVNTFADGDSVESKEKLATFYYTDGSRFRPWRAVDLSHRLPGGGYISSPKDLVKMGTLYFDNTYLRDETREMFWTPQRLADGTVNEQNYALGWRWHEFEFEGLGTVGNANHGGVSRGSQCWLLLYPDHVMSMAFCTNAKTEDFRSFGLFHEPFFRAFLGAQVSMAETSQ